MGMRVDDKDLRVDIHDRFLLYPVTSDEAGILRDALEDITLGTRVGVLCLTIGGRPRVFVRVEGAQGAKEEPDG